MKQVIFMFLCTILLMGATTQEAAAQEKTERHYICTDLRNHITHHLFIRISGYQVELFSKNTSAANPNAKWETRTVTHTSDEMIKYKSTSNHNYELTFNRYTDEVMYFKNVTSNTKRELYILVD